MDRRLDRVCAKLEEMRGRGIWPNGPRYLWTDAFGVCLLVSLYKALGDERYLDEARGVAFEVDRVLGRERGLRIGEAPNRDGQYFHYIAMWLYALGCLGTVDARYHARALQIVRDVHPAFVVPGVGIHWKMEEDLSGPYPGYGLGALDPFHALVVYRLLEPRELAPEIEQVQLLVDRSYRTLTLTQDLTLGMMLWMTHFSPEEAWAATQRRRAMVMLEQLWVDPPGYFCREPSTTDLFFSFTNHGIALGLQAVGAHPERVRRVQHFFESYASEDEYDLDPISHVMGCVSLFPGELIRRGGAPTRAHGATALVG